MQNLDNVGVSELWLRLKNSDEEALRSIYYFFADDLFRFGCSLTSDKELVNDSIQEVFLNVWLYRNKLTNPDNCKFYLLRALSNQIKKEMAKSNMASKRNFETLYCLEDKIMSIEDQIINDQVASEQNKNLNIAFRKLSPKHREIIHLLFFKKMTYEEVAKILQINLRSAYTLAWKALKMLRKDIIISAIISTFF